MRLKQFLICSSSAIALISFGPVAFAGAVTSKEEIAISTTGGGIKIKSDNGNTFQFGGFIQYDFDSYDGAYNAGTADPADIGNSANESEWRRTRITAKGSRGKNWAYDFTIDIDDDAEEASVDAASIRYKGFNNTELILGRLKTPFSLEELTSDKWVSTIERAAIYEVGNFLSGKPDFQFAVHGNWDNLSAQLHFIDEGEEDDDSSDAFSLAARIANRFLIGNQETKTHFAHLGIAYAARDFGNEGSSMDFRSRLTAHTIGDRPTAGNDVVVKNADQFGLEAAYVNGPFSLQGEYLTADFDGENSGPDVDVDGFYALVTYMLTGESRGYKTSNSKFDKPKPKNNLGAWELVAKYEDGEVDIDSQANEAEYDILTLGVNWYPNTNLRFSLNYLMTETDNFQFGGSGGGLTNPTLESLGEDDGDAVSFRAQYAF
ncbi:MAG: OprO/OprP family phosphate-selective porin [Gammaproteobacteria bacterium]